MTKLVDLLDLILVAHNGAVLLTQEEITPLDVILAQSKTIERWYNVEQRLNPPYLKKGYSMLILTEKEVS